MDPNITLEWMRAAIRVTNQHRNLAARYEAEGGLDSTAARHHELADDYARSAVEHAESLDEWMSKGGFLPDGWKVGR